jgi:putative ABC transport system permease protein
VISAGRPGSQIGAGALVGDRLASRLGLKVGDTITVKGHRLPVQGVYHSGIFFEDSGAILSLQVARRIADRPGEETTIAVYLPAATRESVAARMIEREFSGTQVIANAGQAERAGANGTLISKAILVIVVIALIVGAIGVTNTMALAIIERQSELGLLSTVGWSPLRVAALILGEGVAVSLLGAAFGLLLGVVGADLLVHVLGVGAYISPEFTAWALGRGLLVGVAIGVLGGIYPAWRVTRMTPLKALAGT